MPGIGHRRKLAATVRFGRPYPLECRPFEALAFHGTTSVHRDSIETDGLTRFGSGTYGRAVYLNLDRRDALDWAWSSVHRDRVPHGENHDRWPLPMVVTCVVNSPCTLTTSGWNWDLPKALAAYAGVPVPECDSVEEATRLLEPELRRAGVQTLVNYCPREEWHGEVTVFDPKVLTVVECASIDSWWRAA